MEYLREVVKPEYLGIVMQDENLKTAAWLIYVICKYAYGSGYIKKLFDEYLKMKAKGEV